MLGGAGKVAMEPRVDAGETCTACVQLILETVTARGLLGAERIHVDRRCLRLEFADSDLTIRPVRVGDDAGCRAVLSATVRAPAPSLDTWWTSWTTSFPGHVAQGWIAGELGRSWAHVCSLLAERCPTLPGDD